MENEIILVDIDDVVLHWIPGFRKFATEQLGRTIEGNPLDYSMTDWLGLPQPEVRALIDQFDQNEIGFGQLKPLRKSEVYLPKLKSMGHTIIGITASSDVEGSMSRRIENLSREIGEDVISKVHFVNRGEQKGEYLKLYEPTYFIEDKVANARIGEQYGHKGLIMKQPSNEKQEYDTPSMMWVESWEEIFYTIHPELSPTA